MGGPSLTAGATGAGAASAAACGADGATATEAGGGVEARGSRALSEKTGLSEPFLSKLERGRVSTSIANLILISRTVGIELGQLFQDAAAKTGVSPDELTIYRPDGIAVAATLKSDDPASFLAHQMRPFLDALGDHSNLDGTYISLADGSHLPFSDYSGLTDEVKIATARSGNPAGWEPGTLFTGSGIDGEIVQVFKGAFGPLTTPSPLLNALFQVSGLPD